MGAWPVTSHHNTMQVPLFLMISAWDLSLQPSHCVSNVAIITSWRTLVKLYRTVHLVPALGRPLEIKKKKHEGISFSASDCRLCFSFRSSTQTSTGCASLPPPSRAKLTTNQKSNPRCSTSRRPKPSASGAEIRRRVNHIPFAALIVLSPVGQLQRYSLLHQKCKNSC